MAPVRLGDDAYVATGTTVRKDVPAGALVFNVKAERVRPGWVAAKRARAQAPVPEGPTQPRVRRRGTAVKPTPRPRKPETARPRRRGRTR